MTTFRYFAYGSNMLHERLLARCASAKVVGIGVTHGWGLAFTKPGRDGSGKATLRDLQSERGTTPGVLFDIDERELVLLDRAEGVGYERRADIPVRLLEPGVGCCDRDEFPETREAAWGDVGRRAVTYTAIPGTLNEELVPFDWYLALVIAGADQNGLSPHYIDTLRAIPFDADTASARPARRAALRALARAGIDDLSDVLG